LVDDETCAIMLEPVQGEGGVNVPDQSYLEGLRALCDERGMLLIFDEVQTCMGRTGEWFGYQSFGVEPDILTMAKAVAAGVACGVMICQDRLAPSLRPGMHASTFGGNPLAMAAGLATVQMIEDENLLENCRVMSDRFKQHFTKLKCELPIIRELRVRGMMIGIDLTVPATPAVAKCMERGVLINATHDTVVRLLPPINITAEEVDEGAAVIAEVLKELAAAT
jgi:acetylornithine/N-succinyldiaminopimelate aminotransferase